MVDPVHQQCADRRDHERRCPDPAGPSGLVRGPAAKALAGGARGGAADHAPRRRGRDRARRCRGVTDRHRVPRGLGLAGCVGQRRLAGPDYGVRRGCRRDPAGVRPAERGPTYGGGRAAVGGGRRPDGGPDGAAHRAGGLDSGGHLPARRRLGRCRWAAGHAARGRPTPPHRPRAGRTRRTGHRADRGGRVGDGRSGPVAGDAGRGQPDPGQHPAGDRAEPAPG